MRKLRSIIAILLAVLILPAYCLADGLPGFDGLFPENLGENRLLKICEEDSKWAAHVLWENGHCYIPADTLEQLTCYVHEETGPDTGRFIRRTHYLSGGEPQFYVAYNGGSGQLEYHTGYQIRFYSLDGVIERNGLRYLPLDQVLPFLHVQVEANNDCLTIVNDPWSLYDAVSDLDSLAFRMDEITDGGFFRARAAQIANFMIDALQNFRIEYFIPAYDEVNGLSGNQGIHDNIEAAVKGYLSDDSAYVQDDGSLLTVGNGYLFGQNPGGISQTVETLQEMKKTASGVKQALGRMKMEDLGRQLDELHLDEMLTIARAQEFCQSMLTDHYRMLDAMFNFSGAHTGAVSTGYYADVSRYVYEAYSSTWSAMTSDLAKSQATNALIRKGRSEIKGALLTQAQQVILELISRTVSLFTKADRWAPSMVRSYYHDTFTALAEERVAALMRGDLSRDSLEDVRLCSLMLLTASRQGFDELAYFYDNQNGNYADAVQVFRDQAEKIKRCQQILYLCADSIDRDCPDLCSERAAGLESVLQGMHDRRQLYDFDPFAVSGVEITLEQRQSQNGVTDWCYWLTGESGFQEYRIRLPLPETGDPEQDEWLRNATAGSIYAGLDLSKKLNDWDEGIYDLFKDNIAVGYGLSLTIPGLLVLNWYYDRTPAGGPGRYYDWDVRIINLETREDMELSQLFNVSDGEFREGLAEAIAASDDFRAYEERSESGAYAGSSPWSLKLEAITDEGLVFSESHPTGTGNYASGILVPWSRIPFERTRYTEAFR